MTTDSLDNRDIQPLRTFKSDQERLRGTTEIDDAVVHEPEIEPELVEKKETQAAPKTIQKLPQAATIKKSAADFLSAGETESIKNIDTEETDTTETSSTQEEDLRNENPTEETDLSEQVDEGAETNDVESYLEEDITALENTKQPSILEDAQHINTLENDEGVIVQDKKRKRFRLGPAILAAMKDWFGIKKNQIEALQEPEFKIEQAEERVATIAAAAAQSQRAPKRDHDALIEMYKDVKVPEVDTAIKVHEKNESAPSWDHFTSETETELLTEESQEEVATNNIASPEEAFTDSWEEDEAEENANTEEDRWDQQQTLEKEIETEPEISIENITKNNDAAAKNIADSTELPKPFVSNAISNEVVSPAKPRVSIGERIAQIPIWVVLLILLVIIIAGIGTSLTLLQRSVPVEPTVAIIPQEEILLPTLVTTSVPFSVDRDTLRNTIAESQSVTASNQYLRFINGVGLSVPSEQILNVLAPNSTGAFARTISEVVVGHTDTNAQFIVIRGANFDALFGGLLVWETDMSNDLTVVFGNDSNVGEISGITQRGNGAKFVDTVIDGKSARVLVDTENEERLVYLFVSDTVVVITESRNAARSVLEIVN